MLYGETGSISVDIIVKKRVLSFLATEYLKASVIMHEILYQKHS